MMKKTLKVVFVIMLVLVLILSVIIGIEIKNKNKQINSICSTNDLSLISEIIYQLGDVTKDSELINKIEENSDWEFEGVYFDDRQREIIFSKDIKSEIIIFEFGGTSPYLSNYYTQEYIDVNIYSKNSMNRNENGMFDIVDNENLIYSSYKYSKDEDFNINANNSFDTSDEYSNLANEELENFVDIYINSVNTAYCQ